MSEMKSDILNSRWARRGIVFTKTASVMPLLIPFVLAIFSLILVLLLLVGLFNPFAIALGGGITALIVAKTLRGERWRGLSLECLVCDLVIMFVVVSWVFANAFFASQHVFTNRDPAVYATAGAWLIDHDNLRIPAPDAFSGVPDVGSATGGFDYSVQGSKELFAQGAHLLPAFIGLAGRLTDFETALRINAIFGGTMLLALYGFARLITKPRWALLATATMAVTLPMIYFSRDTYTEPLSGTFLFGGLALLWLAVKENSRRLYFLGGLTFGASALVRIDTWLAVATAALGLLLVAAMAERSQKALVLRNVAVAICTMLIVSLVGWLDVSQLSSGYYVSQWLQIGLILKFGALCAVLGLAAVAASFNAKAVSLVADIATNKYTLRIVAGLMAATVAILISRPLWLTVEKVCRTGPGTCPVKYTLAEHSVEWVMWYLGPVLTLLGFVGTGLLVLRILKKGDRVMVVPVLVFGVTALLYFVVPSIAPDQIWASRRYLPLVMPALAVFGFLIIEKLYDAKKVKKGLWSAGTFVVAASLTASIVVVPLSVTLPFISTRTYVPQLDQLQSICRALPANAAVVWWGQAGFQAVQPTYTVCSVPAVAFGKNAALTQQSLVAMYASAHQKGYIPYVGLFHNDANEAELSSLGEYSVVSTISYKELEYVNTRPPRFNVTTTRSVGLAQITPEGRLVKIANEQAR